MKISIITINFNNKEGLEKTIKSVIAQSYANFEYLVIDGHSTDGSLEVIKNYATHISYWVSEPDRGIYHAMNKGIEKASGEYLLFLNSGDYLYDQNVLDALLVNEIENYDLIYGDIIFEVKGIAKKYLYPDVLDFDFFLRDSLPHPCTLIKKSLFHQVGSYDLSLRICADWAFFFDAVFKYNANYLHLDLFVTVFEQNGISAKKENAQAILNEKEKYLTTKYATLSKLINAHKEYHHLKHYLRTHRIFRLFLPESLKKSLREH